MRIMIFGGAGFIGSHLTDKLLDLGHEVLVYDSFISSSRSNVPERAGLVVMQSDIRWALDVSVAMEGFCPDAIIHAAVEPVVNPVIETRDIETNVHGTMNILNSAKKLGVKRIIYFQTSLCYGPTSVTPIPTTHPINPLNSYAISKTCAEKYIMTSELDWISFRLANHYGPRNLCGAVPIFFKNLRDGVASTVVDAKRDFVFVKDLVKLVVKALEAPTDYYNSVYHVASGEEYSIYDLYCKMEDIMDRHTTHKFIPNDPNDMHSMLLDASNTRNVFEWAPTVDIYEGLVQAISYYETNGVEKTYTHLKGV